MVAVWLRVLNPTGEIVISPAVHDLLHNFDSFRSSPHGGAQDSPVAAPASPSAPASDNHPLSCGCTRTASGFYKIRNSLDDMLCAVSFGAPSPAKSSKKAPMYEAPADAGAEVDGELTSLKSTRK